MGILTNQKWETFTQNWFAGKTKEEAAIIAGYKPKWARSIASRLSTKDNILSRYNELQQKAEDATIATVLERKQRLTIFTREDNYNKFGINRQSNIQAITELNKMERVYEDGVKIDNRTVNIYTDSEKGKELTQKLIEGERTE